MDANIITIILGIVSVIGTTVAIYQLAIIKESKKRKNEIQYTLLGIANIALQKQTSWQNQIQILINKQDEDLEIIKIHVKARDEFQEIAGLATSLEGTIDTESSAIKESMDRFIETTKQNNELQAEALKNPVIKK